MVKVYPSEAGDNEFNSQGEVTFSSIVTFWSAMLVPNQSIKRDATNYGQKLFGFCSVVRLGFSNMEGSWTLSSVAVENSWKVHGGYRA
ncbi:MAG: hypothetical protein V1932_04225 [Chloroflexota bacterium]